MHVFFRCLVVAGMLFALTAPVSAAEPKKSEEAIPDKPTRMTERHTPVAVEFEGTDSIGSRLSTRIKEVLNSSNLFTLTEKDTPKIKVLIATTPEFPSRPGVGSAYAVVWLFSQSDSTLRHFLVREVGVLTPDEVNDVAAKIVEKTDALAIRYGYLFQ